MKLRANSVSRKIEKTIAESPMNRIYVMYIGPVYIHRSFIRAI